jgi:hypothetical protein
MNGHRQTGPVGPFRTQIQTCIPRFFLRQQLQEHLPLFIAFGYRKPPFEDDQILAVYKFLHSVLLGRLNPRHRRIKRPHGLIGSIIKLLFQPRRCAA